MSDKTLCKSCDGAGSVPTGIEESPEASCRRCDGDGYEPASSPAMNTASPRLIPDAECAQSRCACATTGCWDECSLKRNPIAMNTASPTAPAACEGCNGYGMVGNILDQDTCHFCGGSGETTAIAGSGPDGYEVAVNCDSCDGTGAVNQGSATKGIILDADHVAALALSGALKEPHAKQILRDAFKKPDQGSATSGEAVSVETQVMQEFLKWNRSQSAPPVVIPKELSVARKVLELRAALAASAEQKPIPTTLHCPECGALHVDEGEWATRAHKTHQCQECKHEWRPYAWPTVGVAASVEQPNSAGSARQGGNTCDLTDYSAPVVYSNSSGNFVERAAAPASVPEGLSDAILQSMYKAFQRGDSVERAHKAVMELISAAPEVAQPAAQGESIDQEKLLELILRWENSAPGSAATEAFDAIVEFIHAWGASQRRAGQLSMSKTIETWGENQRKYGESRADAKLVAENCALVEKLRVAEHIEGKVFEKALKQTWEMVDSFTRAHPGSYEKGRQQGLQDALRTIKANFVSAFATPAPTAGEPSADESSQNDAKDAARYRALFEIEDWCRNPLWPVVDWMRDTREVPKEEIDEALDAAIDELRAAHIKATQGGKGETS